MTEQANEAGWQRFPLLDAAIESESPAVLKDIERTCRELDKVLQTGSEREKERARTALIGYARAMELYRHLTNLRDEALGAVSNISPGAPINQ